MHSYMLFQPTNLQHYTQRPEMNDRKLQATGVSNFDQTSIVHETDVTIAMIKRSDKLRQD